MKLIGSASNKLIALAKFKTTGLSKQNSFQIKLRFSSTPGSDESSEEALSKLSVKELRQKIVKAGYSNKDCYEKTDLVKRAFDSLNLAKENEANRKEAGNKSVVESIRRWVDGMVIGLDLCPFAKANRSKTDIFILNQSTQVEKVFADDDYIAQIDRYIEKMIGNDSCSTPTSKTMLLVITDPLYKPISSWTSFVHRFTSEPRQGRDVYLNPIPNVIRLNFYHPKIVKAGLQENSPYHFISRAPFPIIQLLKRVDVDEAIDQYFEHYPEATIVTEDSGDRKIAELTEKNQQTLDLAGLQKLKVFIDGNDNNNFKEEKELADFQRMFRMLRENISRDMNKKSEVPYHRIKLAQLANELDQHGDAGEIIFNNKRRKTNYDHLPVVAKLLKDIEVLLSPVYEERKKERESFGSGPNF